MAPRLRGSWAPSRQTRGPGAPAGRAGPRRGRARSSATTPWWSRVPASRPSSARVRSRTGTPGEPRLRAQLRQRPDLVHRRGPRPRSARAPGCARRRPRGSRRRGDPRRPRPPAGRPAVSVTSNPRSRMRPAQGVGAREVAARRAPPRAARRSSVTSSGHRRPAGRRRCPAEAQHVEQLHQLVARLAELGGARRRPRPRPGWCRAPSRTRAAKASGVSKSSSSARKNSVRPSTTVARRGRGRAPPPAGAAMARSSARRALASRSTTACGLGHPLLGERQPRPVVAREEEGDHHLGRPAVEHVGRAGRCCPMLLLIFSSPSSSISLCIQMCGHRRPRGRPRTGRSRSRGGGRRGRCPPPWTSKPWPRAVSAIAEHSMCQPGRPGPQGDVPPGVLVVLAPLPEGEVERRLLPLAGLLRDHLVEAGARTGARSRGSARRGSRRRRPRGTPGRARPASRSAR